MNRPMEELAYKTHPYSGCLDDDCGECERYYCEDIHPDSCDSACEQPCWLCTCDECMKLKEKGDVEMSKSTNDLINELANLKSILQTLRDEISQKEFELIQELNESGATAIPHPEYEVKLTPPIKDANDTILRPLLEREDIGDLIIDEGAYIPPHKKEIEVKAKWDFGKLNKLKKYGTDVAAIIESGKITTAKLTIKPKKKRGDD